MSIGKTPVDSRKEPQDHRRDPFGTFVGAGMSRRPKTVLHLAILLVVGGISGCKKPAAEEDLQLWTRNDRGLERLRQVMSDPSEPIDTKVRALEIMVERGLPRQARPMIDAASNEERPAVVKKFKETALELLKDPKKSAMAAYAKDVLLTLHRYLSAEEFEEIQRAVAAWAFDGITWDSASDDVKKIGDRISTGQIADLGAYAKEGAAIIMSHGFKTEKMAEFLMKPAKKGGKETPPAARKNLLRAMKLLNKRIGLQRHHLEALNKIPGPETAVFLYGLYLDGEADEQIKTVAFNYADRMLSDKNVRESKAVVDAIFELYTKSSDPNDRWTATTYLVRLGGAKHLAKAMTYFKDDKRYNDGESEADRQLLDFCLDLFDRGHAEASRPLFHKLAEPTNPNRVTRAMSIVCMKAHRDFSALPALEAMAKKWARKNKPEDQVYLTDFLDFDPKLSLKTLITNAIESLKALKTIKGEFDAKKLSDVEYEFKQRSFIFPLDLTGEELAKRAAQDYADWQVKYKESPKEFDDEVRNRGK